MRSVVRSMGVLLIAALACSCSDKPPDKARPETPLVREPRLTQREYAEICEVVDRFRNAVGTRDIKTLRRVSPLVAFSVEEGMMDPGELAHRFGTGGQETGRIVHIVPGGSDALAFTARPETGSPALWYYVQEHDSGRWVVQFCDTWDATVPSHLFDDCRAVVRKAATAQNIRAIEKAVARYRQDCGALPTEAEGLGALLDNPGHDHWNGPYLHLEALIDPWGTAFQYRRVDGRPHITSAGADRDPGNDDDIHVKPR